LISFVVAAPIAMLRRLHALRWVSSKTVSDTAYGRPLCQLRIRRVEFDRRDYARADGRHIAIGASP
jgi:hypothetical protein